mgnify:CR=1 FL=1
MRKSSIPAIDIFAGPGGLAEGFSNAEFDIRLSVEMDEHAHQTLRFRSFCRKLIKARKRKALTHFYKQLEGKSTPEIADFTNKHPELWKQAEEEAFRATLGIDDPKDISRRIEKALGSSEEWVLLGGPPCQAYSLAGRSRMQNAEDYRQKRGHEFAEDHRHQLYKEYLRIVAVHAPSIFVMENVKGLLSSKHKGARILEQIKIDLQRPRKATRAKPRRLLEEKLEYELFPLWAPASRNLLNETTNQEFIVKAEEQGVPQARHRLFIIGLRKDLSLKMQHLEKVTRTLEAWDVLRGLPELHSSLSKQKDLGWLNYVKKFPSTEAGKWTKENEPAVLVKIVKALNSIEVHKSSGGLAVEQVTEAELPELFDWYGTLEMPVALNHEARGHMPSDLHRYLYSSAFSAVHGYSPKLKAFPPCLLPAHKNVNKRNGEAIFDDRFRTQCKEKPSSTITSHIHKDGHYFIHPDTAQCRSLTVREAARLQTFPEDFNFLKSDPRYVMGMSVPPFMTQRVALEIYNHWFKTENN